MLWCTCCRVRSMYRFTTFLCGQLNSRHNSGESLLTDGQNPLDEEHSYGKRRVFYESCGRRSNKKSKCSAVPLRYFCMSDRLNIPGETQRVWICVLKTSDLMGPRRRVDRPRVLVKALTKRPGLELDRWVKTSRRAKRMLSLIHI